MCIVGGKRRTGFAWFLSILTQHCHCLLLITISLHVLCYFYMSIIHHYVLCVVGTVYGTDDKDIYICVCVFYVQNFFLFSDDSTTLSSPFLKNTPKTVMLKLNKTKLVLCLLMFAIAEQSVRK